MADYVPEHYTIVGSHSKKGKAFNYTQRILGYYTAGDEVDPASISDVKDVLRSSGRSGSDFVNIAIGGSTPARYPWDEGTIQWRSYVYTWQNLWDYANIPDLDTATDWMNLLLMGLGESWDEVYIVRVIDR